MTGGAHARRGRGGPTWRSAAFAAALVVLVGSGVGLAYAGVRTVRDSTAGQRFDPTLEPDQPGFEAYVEPTPATVLLHDGPDGLVSAVLLSLRGEGAGGGVLVVPGRTVVDPASGRRLDEVHAEAGSEATLQAVERMLTVGTEGAKVVDDLRWAELVEPVAPLQLSNPDELDGFPAGPVQLQPDDVGPWLEATGPGTSGANQLVRQVLFWERWIDSLRSSSEGAAIVPGEVDAGLGRFISGLADGPVQVSLLPAREELGDDLGPRFIPEPSEVNELVAQLVPFPTGAEPGARVRLRILDGTGDPELALRAVPALVRVGAEVVIVGNASDGFGHVTSTLRVHDPRLDGAAQMLRGALGLGEIEPDPKPTDAYDLTIVLGADAAGALR